MKLSGFSEIKGFSDLSANDQCRSVFWHAFINIQISIICGNVPKAGPGKISHSFSPQMHILGQNDTAGMSLHAEVVLCTEINNKYLYSYKTSLMQTIKKTFLCL